MAPSNTLPVHGNEKTMNLNSLVLANIQASPYFKVYLYELKTYHQVVDEIYYKVNHLEPWEKGSRNTAGQTGMCGGVRGVGTGGIVSSSFCLLYKLFTLKLTRKQLIGVCTHTDSPYIRGLGLMYIRFTQPPPDLWDWYEPYLDDEEEVDVKAGGGHVMTIGEMCVQMLTRLEWYSTLFPRIPIPIQKTIENNLAAHRAKAGYSKGQGHVEAVSGEREMGENRGRRDDDRFDSRQTGSRRRSGSPRERDGERNRDRERGREIPGEARREISRGREIPGEARREREGERSRGREIPSEARRDRERSRGRDIPAEARRSPSYRRHGSRDGSRSRDERQRSRLRDERHSSRSHDIRHRSRSRDTKRGSKSREDKPGSRSRDNKRRSRSRDNKRRSRSRDGKRRSRSRDGKRRSRSRENGKVSRSRGERHGSRSHDEKHRSRSHRDERSASGERRRRHDFVHDVL